jgi:hypothetical protein
MLLDAVNFCSSSLALELFFIQHYGMEAWRYAMVGLRFVYDANFSSAKII